MKTIQGTEQLQSQEQSNNSEKWLSLENIRKGLKVKSIKEDLMGVVTHVLRYADHALITILWEKKTTAISYSFFAEPIEGVSAEKTENYKINKDSFPHLSDFGKDIYIID